MTATAHRAALPAIYKPDTYNPMKAFSPIFLAISAALLLSAAHNPTYAKKIKQSLRIDKEKAAALKGKEDAAEPEGLKIDALVPDSLLLCDGSVIAFDPDDVTFAGYDKQASASTEDFLLVNNTGATITGISIRIDYADMSDRMLHSRTVTTQCHVPPGETRKIEIKTWDRQHSYYYYLGNEPRRVATPYKVAITPLYLWLE